MSDSPPASSAPEQHVPVLLDRVVGLLAPALQRPDAVLVDATVGLGGHAVAVLDAFPHTRVIGIDRDPEALRGATFRISAHASRTTLVHAVYDELPAVLERCGLPSVQGVLFDLGVSSLQLDEVPRGFSYARDAPLDMRMDATTGRTAAEVLNSYTARDLSRVLKEYGEERFAGRIADRVVRTRVDTPFESTAQLVDVIRAAIPAAARRAGGHPAKRTFQALRIEVNDELATLRRAVPRAVAALAVGGRIVVLSYQSLEDRIVKRVLAGLATDSAPLGLPVIPDFDQPQLRLLTRGAERASEHEVSVNPRAASVRLRAAERIREAA